MPIINRSQAKNLLYLCQNEILCVMSHTIIEHLNWRYATKRYDPTKKIPETQLDLIKESLRLAPTSYGLQPLKFLFVENQEIRQQLLPFSHHQRVVVDASHLLVIATHTNIPMQEVDDYLQNTANTRGIPLEDLSKYGQFLKQTINDQTPDERKIWAQKQAYITLGILVHTCAQLRIDATPIEGFQAHGYDNILGLKQHDLTTTLIVPIGFRHPQDNAQYWKKVRKSKNELFEDR